MNTIGMIVTLTKEEQSFAMQVGQRRYESCRANAVKDATVGGCTGAMHDAKAFGAELAFAKLFNVYPDTSISPRGAESDSGDAIYRGEIIDVKSTPYRDGRLIARPVKRVCGIDHFALMVERWPVYEFRGFVAAAALFQSERLTDLGHGPTYAADQAELTEWDGLF